MLSPVKGKAEQLITAILPFKMARSQPTMLSFLLIQFFTKFLRNLEKTPEFPFLPYFLLSFFGFTKGINTRLLNSQMVMRRVL